MISSKSLDPIPLTTPLKQPDGVKKMDAPMLTDNCVCNGSTMGSSVISQRVSGGKAIPGGKSPSLAQPARMRNR